MVKGLLASLICMVGFAAGATWNCTATCSGYGKKVLGTLQYDASGPDYSDFSANCTQVLGGDVHMIDAGQCDGTSWVCDQYFQSSDTLSGSDDTLLAARQQVRTQCTSANDLAGDCGTTSSRWYLIDESSWKCTQDQ